MRHKKSNYKTKHHKTYRQSKGPSKLKNQYKYNRILKKSIGSTKEKETNKNNFWNKITLRYKIFLVLLFLNILTYLIFNSLFQYIIFFDIIFIIIWIWGWTNSCPKCKSHWARKLVDRSNFGSHTEFEHIQRNVTHRNSEGNIIGSSSVEDTKPITLHAIQNHWTCKYCGHSWSGRVHDIKR